MRSEAGFIAVAFTISLGMVFAGFLYLFHSAVVMRARQELQQAADSLALAAAGALREKGLRLKGQINIDMDILVQEVAEPNLEAARIVEHTVQVLDAGDDDYHESLTVELRGELKAPFYFLGFRYGARPFTANAEANIMRWVLTEERYPIVLVLADASDRMSDMAPHGGEERHWDHLRKALIEIAETKHFPSRFGLVAFRDPRTMDERNGTVGIQDADDPWMLKQLGIPEYRWKFNGLSFDDEAGEEITSDKLDGYREYLKDESAHDETVDDVRVLPTAEPQLDNWEQLTDLLQEQLLANPGGHTNLGNALARAQYLIETNDAQQVDRTAIVVSNDRPFVPFDPELGEGDCSQEWFGLGTRCDEMPDLSEVRNAFLERAAELRQVDQLGASLATIKLRNRDYSEMVCDLFRRLCKLGKDLANKAKGISEVAGNWVENSLLPGFCDPNQAPGASAGGETASAGEGGAAGGPGSGAAPQLKCEQTEQWGKDLFAATVSAVETALTLSKRVRQFLQQFSGLLRVPLAIFTYVKTRVGSTGKADDTVEEWIKPLSGGPFDEVGDDPRYHTQVDTPSEESGIVMALAHFACVYDPLASLRTANLDDDPGRIAPGSERTWAPFAFIRDADNAESRLDFFGEEGPRDDVETHAWNADSALEMERRGYRLPADRLLAVRLTMKSCEELGMDPSNRLVIRWGPPRLGKGPEHD